MIFGLSNLISKFADDTKIGNAVHLEGDRRNLQEDLGKILVTKMGNAF